MAFRILWIASCVTTMHSVWKDEKFPESGVSQDQDWSADPQDPLMMADGGPAFLQAQYSGAMQPPPPERIEQLWKVPTTTTSPCPLDCNQGYQDLDPLEWVRGWSGEKKLYCCKTAGKGCPRELPPPSGLPEPRVPVATPSDLPCPRAPAAAPTNMPAEAPSAHHNCDADFSTKNTCWKKLWNPTKMIWCCKHHHRGCGMAKWCVIDFR